MEPPWFRVSDRTAGCAKEPREGSVGVEVQLHRPIRDNFDTHSLSPRRPGVKKKLDGYSRGR
jgi:hypothetical protein